MSGKLNREIFVTLALLLFFFGMIISAQGLHPLVRLFPLLVCIPMIVVLSLQLMTAFNPKLKSFLDKISVKLSLTPNKNKSQKIPISLGSELRLFFWLLLLLTFLYVLGILPSAAVFLIFFLRIASTQSWKTTFVITLSVLTFIYLLFGVILEMTLFSEWLV